MPPLVPSFATPPLLALLRHLASRLPHCLPRAPPISTPPRVPSPPRVPRVSSRPLALCLLAFPRPPVPSYSPRPPRVPSRPRVSHASRPPSSLPSYRRPRVPSPPASSRPGLPLATPGPPRPLASCPPMSCPLASPAPSRVLRPPSLSTLTSSPVPLPSPHPHASPRPSPPLAFPAPPPLTPRRFWLPHAPRLTPASRILGLPLATAAPSRPPRGLAFSAPPRALSRPQPPCT
ncbi:hypothetical protein BOTBODRAFT_193337 [Botryobasidium botryosum FD-172 SS1]|uniref:Uncharacterized protein n=1 Tax=Botryobasidium botryosum (strain FD-172 SS1) TaxID=930990 RepID=A0A067LQK4_BOTB1|nr:hypothetical protein BOTBODRAFT_193337 [Botryobasidium botryosum FD-172 SS1]